MDINIDLTNIRNVINSSFYPLLENRDRYLVLRGGAGSGKSHFAAQKILIRILATYDKTRHKVLVVRKTRPAARRSVFTLFKYYVSEWGLSNICKINNTDMSFTFDNSSDIIISGVDDPEKLKSIEGVTSAWLEEATELTRDDFTQINLRLRGASTAYKQAILSFNPVSKISWVYDRFFKGNPEDTLTHHSTYKDNRFLDREYIKTLEQLIDEDLTYYKIYTLGEWTEIGNIIYTNWSEVKDFPVAERTIYGCDFGYNSPTALLEVGIKEEGLYLKELLYRTKLTNSELIDWIKKTLPQGSIIYCDSAEPNRIAEMRKAGISAKKADKSPNSVKDGIDFVKRQVLHITKDSSNLLKEIQGYKYKETRDKLVLDEPVKFNDHLMDAMRYAIYTHMGKAIKYNLITGV